MAFLKNPARRSAGFTLMELLVALVILGMLVGLIGPRVMKYVSGAKSDTAKIQIEDLAAALDMYHLEIGSYPSEDVGLTALIEPPAGVSGWNGPYLRKKVVPKDPWGRDYIYRYPGENGPFDLYSYGADGQPGGDNENRDLNSWE